MRDNQPAATHHLVTTFLLVLDQDQDLRPGLRCRQVPRHTSPDIPRPVITRHPSPPMHQRAVRMPESRFLGHRIVPVPVGGRVVVLQADIPAVGPLHGRNPFTA